MAFALLREHVRGQFDLTQYQRPDLAWLRATGLADAVVALVSNMAAKQRRRIEFKPAWFDVNSDEAPESALES